MTDISLALGFGSAGVGRLSVHLLGLLAMVGAHWDPWIRTRGLHCGSWEYRRWKNSMHMPKQLSGPVKSGSFVFDLRKYVSTGR